jgi:hypothetical protein
MNAVGGGGVVWKENTKYLSSSGKEKASSSLTNKVNTKGTGTLL